MKHAKTTRIKDAYPNGFNGDGIFSDLQKMDVPWKDENISGNLDVLYHSLNDDKPTSKLIRRRMVDDESLNALNRDIVASTLCIVYLTQWRKLYDVLSMEYNPIENYRMIESETSSHLVETQSTDTGDGITTEKGTDTTLRTGTDTTTETGTDTTLRTGTDTTTETGTDTITHTGTVGNTETNQSANAVYGFNSTSAVNTDTVNGSGSGNETRNLTDTDTKDLTTTETLNLSDKETKDLTTTETLNLSDAETKNLTTTETRDFAATSNESGENEREIMRSGNIGVTTSQQLIQSEIELWQWNYFNQVFSDINKIIALETY